MPEPDRPTTRDQPVLRMASAEHGDGLVVSLDGEFDLASARLVQEELERARESYGVVVLDLRGVTFMDSTGLHVVLGASQRMSESGGAFRIVPGGPQVQRLFRLTGVTKHLEVVPVPGSVGAEAQT